jgi:hypothetical protein
MQSAPQRPRATSLATLAATRRQGLLNWLALLALLGLCFV